MNRITRRRLIIPAAAATVIAAPRIARSQFFNPPMFMPQAAGAFNPTSLITGGGGFWRADMGVTGSPNVTAWSDQSSFANNLTNIGTSPTFSATGFNASFSGISFAFGNNENMGANITFASTTVSFFVLLAWVTNSNGSHNRVCGMIANGAGSDFTNPSITSDDGGTNAQINWSFFSSAQLGNGGGTVNNANGSIHLIGLVCDGTHANLWQDGAVVGTQTNFSSTVGASPNALRIGAMTNTNAGFTCAFWGVTQKAMNGTDWTNLKNWSNSNWGTSF